MRKSVGYISNRNLPIIYFKYPPETTYVELQQILIILFKIPLAPWQLFHVATHQTETSYNFVWTVIPLLFSPHFTDIN